MTQPASPVPNTPLQAPTGIAGFDEVTGGGLPRGRTTLLVGGAGTGKTVFALEFLVHGARACAEPGIFVAFEEAASRLVINASSFGWDLPGLMPHSLFFVDAQPSPDLIRSGDFDLGGVLAALDAKCGEIKAQRIVFDAMDVVLALLPDADARRREIYRLHEWLLARGITGLVTSKSEAGDTGGPGTADTLAFRTLLYTVDCAVILKHCVEHGISRRSVRVQKYRGRAFNEDEAPLLIGRSGMEVAVTRTVSRADVTVSNERVSSGIGQLDTMLAGGFFRGSTTLITGASGTAKTTLGGAFAQAACQRGERTLFVSFDSDCSEVVRNLASVGILLTPHLDEGSLRMISARTIAGSAETYLMRIRNLAEAHQARCLVIDPIYLDSKTAGDLMAQRVADQLIDWSKSSGRTLLCTRLLDENSNIKDGGSPLQISMIVDTWLHLNYLVQGNERVRTLSIIKSRGTPHSNKVRGLHLAHGGVTLDDTWSRDSGAREGTP